MSEFTNFLNQNQGVLKAIALGITIIGGAITWFLKKGKNTSSYQNSPHIKAGRSVTAGRDIIVGGRTQIVNEKKPAVTMKMGGFTHTQGRLDLIFENMGDSTAVVKGLQIAGEEVSINEFSLTPQQKTTKRANVTGFKVLGEKVDKPEMQLLYKDFSTGKKYQTVGLITQEPRADGKYNLGIIKDLAFVALNKKSS